VIFSRCATPTGWTGYPKGFEPRHPGKYEYDALFSDVKLQPGGDFNPFLVQDPMQDLRRQ
jgi:hypothetical protein